MIRVAASVIFYLAALCAASAQYSPYIGSGNVPVAPQVMLCAGPGKTAIECGTNAIPLPTQSGVGTASGGFESLYRLPASLATTNGVAVKGTTTKVYKITGYNTSASVKWLRLYNRSTSPVVGTNVAYIVFAMPPGAFSYDAYSVGFSFSAGLGIALTGAAPDTDATAVAAGDIVSLQIFYQ